MIDNEVAAAAAAVFKRRPGQTVDEHVELWRTVARTFDVDDRRLLMIADELRSTFGACTCRLLGQSVAHYHVVECIQTNDVVRSVDAFNALASMTNDYVNDLLDYAARAAIDVLGNEFMLTRDVKLNSHAIFVRPRVRMVVVERLCVEQFGI